MTYPTQIVRRVTAADVATLDDRLNSSVEALIPDALALNHGIRVTRVGPGDCLVETTPDVQCGYTIYKSH